MPNYFYLIHLSNAKGYGKNLEITSLSTSKQRQFCSWSDQLPWKALVNKKSAREERMAALSREVQDRGQSVTTRQIADLICYHFFSFNF
jgi:hypothetical protein